ncbi:MAG: hypothetical protein QM831_45765 [Kofleriaceae bacterium]
MRSFAAVLVLFAACKHDAGAELFGKKVVPPGALAKVKYGETLDDLKKQFPDTKVVPGKGNLLAQPAKNTRLFAIDIDGVVADTYVTWEGKDGIAMLTQAWGPPDAEPGRDNNGDKTWRNVETGWRASARCWDADANSPAACSIKFMPHKPLEAMFDKSIHPPGELAAAHMGMTRAEVDKLVPLGTSKGMHLRDLAYDGASEIVTIDDRDRLMMLHYKVPEIAGPMIEKAWGPGTKRDKETLYFDPASHWEASVERDDHAYRIAFTAFDTFDHEIDLLSELSHLPDQPAAKKAHPELDWRTSEKGEREFIMMPPHEFAWDASRMMNGVSVSIYPGRNGIVLVQLFEPDQLAGMRAALTKKWGEPKADKRKKDDEHRVHLYWPGHGEISGHDDADAGSYGLFIDQNARSYDDDKKK